MKLRGDGGNNSRLLTDQSPAHDLIGSIQYLRALAAMMVVWLHSLYVIPGAREQLGRPYLALSGVDIFFVISGFIMVVTTARKDLTPAEFFCRRIVRVVPLYWLATLAMIAGAASVHSFKNLGYPPVAIAKSLLFIPYTAVEGKPGSVWPILLQGWTLNFEMFFYALFALSLAAPPRLRLPGLTVTLVSLVVIGSLFGPFAGPLARVYTNPMLLEFAGGMILAHGWLRDRSREWLSPSLLLVVVGFVVFCFYDIGSPHSWSITTYSTLIRMTGAFIIVAACLHPKIYAIQSPPLLELGNASYAIYLVHQFVLDGLAWTWVRAFPLVTWASSALFMAVALLLCAVAGWLCYRFVEWPLTSYLRSFVKRSASVASDCTS